NYCIRTRSYESTDVLHGGGRSMGCLKSRFSISGIGRALFGGVLAYTALDNFRDLDGVVTSAESKGVPAAGKLVPFSSGMLLFGAFGIALDRFGKLAPGAIVTWFVGVTPQMHDFWNMEGDRRHGHKNHFLKNLAILGAAIIFLSLDSDD